MDYLTAAIQIAAAGSDGFSPDALEAEVYPHEGFGLEVIRYMRIASDGDPHDPMALTTPLGSVVLQLNTGAFTIHKNPWRPL